MVIFLDIDDTINDFTIQMDAIEPMWFLSSTLARTLFFCYNNVFKNCHLKNTDLLDQLKQYANRYHHNIITLSALPCYNSSYNIIKRLKQLSPKNPTDFKRCIRILSEEFDKTPIDPNRLKKIEAHFEAYTKAQNMSFEAYWDKLKNDKLQWSLEVAKIQECICVNDWNEKIHYLNSHTILIDDSQKTLSEAHSLGYKAFDFNQISPKEMLDQFSPTVLSATKQKLQQIQKAALEVQGALEAQETVEEKIETKTQITPPIWTIKV